MEQRAIFRNTMDPRVCESSSRLKICIYIYVYRDRMNNSLLFWEKLVRLIIFQDDIYFLARTPDLPTVCIDSLTLTFAAKYLETHLSTHKDSF